MAEDAKGTEGSRRMGEQDGGMTTLLAGWLLAHELADDWIRDAVARGREPGADPMASLAAAVDGEKERLRQALAADVGVTDAPREVAELKESVEALARRVASLEARLDGISERLAREG